MSPFTGADVIASCDDYTRNRVRVGVARRGTDWDARVDVVPTGDAYRSEVLRLAVTAVVAAGHDDRLLVELRRQGRPAALRSEPDHGQRRCGHHGDEEQDDGQEQGVSSKEHVQLAEKFPHTVFLCPCVYLAEADHNVIQVGRARNDAER